MHTYILIYLLSLALGLLNGARLEGSYTAKSRFGPLNDPPPVEIEIPDAPGQNSGDVPGPPPAPPALGS